MDIWTFLNSSLLGVIIGAAIAGTAGYYQSKRQQEYEFRKDLAAAIRIAYADFLKEVFKGGDQTEAGMSIYFSKLRAAYGPVFLLGSKDVKQNIDLALRNSDDILKGSESEENKMERINELLEKKEIEKLRDSMWEDVCKWQDHLKRYNREDCK
jgi:hypothetical protein